ncbi:MAG: hypothetical protein WCH40_04510 [Verrucomicrobiales bacterium]
MRTALFLLILSLSATAEKSTRTCRILFLAAPESALKTLFLFDGKTAQEVELTRMGFSPIYKVSPETLSLALLPTAPPPATGTSDAPVVPAGAPVAGIAGSIRDFYLIVSSDAANQVAPVKMQVVDADAANFKPGQMLWFNLTQNKVGGTVGTRKLVINPNSRVILEEPANRSEEYHVNIQFIPPGKERPEPLCETNWSHDPRSRSVLFILHPPGSNIPRIQGFPDFRDADPEKKN